MAFELPQSRRQVRQIQLQKRNIPLEQIIAVQGQSPVATGIETAGNLIGQALARKAALQREGQILAKLESLSGKQPGTYTGLDPQTATSLTSNLIKQNEEKFTPDQVSSIMGGNATQMTTAFPRGVPKEALTLALSSGRKTALEEERDRAQADRIDKNILSYSEALEKNPVVKQMRTQDVSLGQMDNLIQLAKGGNTVASSAMGIKMARAMGEVGVLTESDIKRYVQSGQLARGVGDKLSLWIQGRPTEATLEEIGQIATVLKDSFSTKVQPVYDTYVNRLSRNLGLSLEDAAFRLDVPYMGSQKKGLPKLETPKPMAIPALTGKKKTLAEKLGL